MTEEEKKELETLRQEKRQRLQQQRAREALEAAGAPVTFAGLLAGTDDGDTDRRTREFCDAYQASLAEDIRQRLPQEPPAVVSPAPRRPQRGIRHIR